MHTQEADQTQSTNADRRKKPAIAAKMMPLSPTEMVVCSMLLRRMTEREIANELGRSHNTVHVHVRNIYRKKNLNNRQELFDLYDAIGDKLFAAREQREGYNTSVAESS